MSELRKKVIDEIVTQLGYKGFDDTWGNEKLLDGKHGDCCFSSTMQDMFNMLVSARYRLAKNEQPEPSFRD